MAETLQERQNERDRAEEALRRSEADYRSLVLNSPYGIMRSTPEGRIHRANPALVKMLGYDTEEEVLGLNLLRDINVTSSGDAAMLGKSTEEDPRDVSLCFRRKDGKEIQIRASGRWVRDESGRVHYIESILEDVTERKSLEAQLVQAQKMEAVGRLAGGVAHDFNNLLGVMLGYSELLLGEMDAADPRRQRVSEIKRASDRAASLTRQLLAFSRRQVLTPRVVDLNAVVDSLDKMLRRLIGEDVNLISRLGAEVGRVRIDPNQIDQVLMNLVVNARDAMPEGGKIILETANLDLRTSQVYENMIIPPGSYVRLAVTDTGMGMDDETRAHIFEPFFTTKEVGKGTGLGLSMVYGIVRQSGGHILSRSRPGKGTTFEIYLPRVDESAEAGAPARSPQDLPRGSETVLLVEDEDALRDLLREFLASGGLHGPGGLERIGGGPDRPELPPPDPPPGDRREHAGDAGPPGGPGNHGHPPRGAGALHLRVHRRRGAPGRRPGRGHVVPGEAVHPGIPAAQGAGGAGWGEGGGRCAFPWRRFRERVGRGHGQEWRKGTGVYPGTRGWDAGAGGRAP